MDTSVITLNEVAFSYDNGPTVLESVNLTVREGAFLAIIGPNGGGKTTLVKLMLGLVKPQHGQVRVLGVDPAHDVPSIGYVPQHSDFEANFPITVLDVVLLGMKRPRLRLGLPKEFRERAMSALIKVDMAPFANRRFDALSGGQRQRVLVARAIVSEPRLLLFDEPTSNIDPHGKMCLFDMMAELSKDLTVVMVSHDLISASSGITDVAVVNRRLIQGTEITAPMLELLYGTHAHTCPLDGYIQSLTHMFESRVG